MIKRKWLDDLVNHYRADGPVVLLESQLTEHPAAAYSYLAARPKAIIKAYGNHIEIQSAGEIKRFDANPWEALSSFQKQCNDWLFGYLGYDLKNHLETLQSDNTDAIQAPDLFFMQPRLVLKIDEKKQKITAVKGSTPKKVSRPQSTADVTVSGLHATVSKKGYCATIEQAKQAIYEGEYYEINISHPLQAQFTGSPYGLYQKMRYAGPVPFGAYIQFDDMAICSASPERFLRKNGQKVYSQPIKGTIKRADELAEDKKLAQALAASAKNRAENMMIVDLVRNDLSRIARPGSVKVPRLFEIQTFGTVHQMVSTVCAETRVGQPVEIIRACFPMGSMTGAPKLRVMQAIEHFENYRRGIYSGAIGYISPNGDFDFNVVIRTAIIKDKLLSYAVGGAITGDSEASDEWEETWLKAKALRKAVNDCAHY